MSFFSDFFESDEKKRRKSHFRNLLAVAAADGHIDDDEVELLYRLGAKNYLTAEEVRRVMQDPASIRFVVPENPRQALDQLWELVSMMLADGEIDPREMALCRSIALRYNFRPAVVDAIVQHLMEGVVRGLAAEIVLHRVAQLIED